jgi:excisionase family DNA binding protein
MNPQESGLATVQEACAYLRLTRTGFTGLVRRGDLKIVRLGKCLRVPWSELTGLIQRQLGREQARPA